MQLRIQRYKGGYAVVWEEYGKRKRYKLSASTRAEAEVEAPVVYRRHKAGASNEVISVLWGEYIDFLGSRPNAKTLQYTGKPILAHFGKLSPSDILPEHSRAYIAKRRNAGRKDGTIHTELGHLRNCLNHHVKYRRIPYAPYIERPSKPKPKEDYLDPEQVQLVISSSVTPHITLALHLLWGTAARIGAVLDLRWDQVDFESGQINLRSEGSETRKGRAIVPMTNTLRAALQTAYMARQTPYVIEYGSKPVKSIKRGIQAVQKASGIKLNLHMLRHSAAVHMVKNGISLEKVGQYLGHSNPKVTYDVYARFAPDHMRDAANVLELGDFVKSTKRSEV